MSTLKTIEKGKVRFLMDYDYNNILGRLKFVLGQDASFFADIQVRKNDITWSTKSNLEYKPFCEASENERQDIRKSIEIQKQRISRIISDDALIGNDVNQIMTFPSEQYVYYAMYNDNYNVIIAGWGCCQMEHQHEEHGYNQEEHSHNNVDSNHQNRGIPTKEDVERTKKPHHNHQKATDGFFISSGKTPQKKNTKRPKGEILKSLLLLLLATILVLIIPMFLTPITNRFVADVTHQWYLSGGTRVFITLFITSVTYALAYISIRFTTLKESIIFNSICLILTFLWCVLVGFLYMP